MNFSWPRTGKKVTALRGLDIEFAGANAPGGGTIYVNGLGKNQNAICSRTPLFSNRI
jgi:hypothetical protein